MTQKMISHLKSEVHLLSCQLDVEADELEKKDPLSASFKMLLSNNDYKIGRRALIRCTHFVAHQHIALTN